MTILGTDLDDTLWNHADPFFEYCKERLGYGNGKADAYLAYALDKHYGLSREQLEKAFIGVIEERTKFEILPYPKVKRTLEELKIRKIKTIAITSRGEKQFKKATEDDLNLFFPELIAAVHYTNDMWKDNEPIINKKIICEREKVTDFVDDSVSNVLDVSQLGINCYLINRPWNKNINIENVLRINGIEEILNYVTD